MPSVTIRRPVRIGLELGERALTVVWTVRHVGGRVELRCRQQRRSAGASAEALRRDLAQLLAPLRRHRLRGRPILAAPPSYIRRLTVPAQDAKRIPEAVREQLPALLPFDVQQAQFSYLVQEPRSEGVWTVSVAACEAAPLQHALEALWQIGWVSSAVTPAALALAHTARAVQAVGPEPIILMEMGEDQTTMALVMAGDVISARDVALGLGHLEDALMSQVSIGERTLSLAREEATALAREVGIPQDATASTVGRAQLPLATYRAMIQPVLEQLVTEVRRTMSLWAQNPRAPIPQRILVSGAGAQLPGCEPWLSGQLEMPVARLNCDPLLDSYGSTAAVACGLALFDRPPALDLQPKVFRRRVVATRFAARLWPVLAWAALLVGVGAGSWHVGRRHAAQQLATLTARSDNLAPVRILQEAVAGHAQLVRRLEVEQSLPVAWFHQLAHEFPNSVRLMRVRVGADHGVSLVGEAQEREQSPEAHVSELTLWLEQAAVCQDVQLGSTSRLQETGNIVEFALTCRLPP